jgi:hypothetical protein
LALDAAPSLACIIGPIDAQAATIPIGSTHIAVRPLKVETIHQSLLVAVWANHDYLPDLAARMDASGE